MKTYMFPGQGSQSKGMGAGLFEAFPELTAKADAILGYSIKELCTEDPRGELNQTQFTQPALFVVNALSYLQKVSTDGKPDFLAGHSLGEFNALWAADVFDFETALRLVCKRGELMSKAPPGGMAAILNASKEQIEEALQAHGLTAIDLANYNTPAQIVISGAIDEIAKAQHCFKGNALYYPLNTSGAFHSRFMKPAQEEFSAYLSQFELRAPAIPVIANVTARPYVSTELASTLASQIASTVRWSESMQYLLGLDAGMEFVEVGHGDVLSKMIRTIRQRLALAAATAPAPAIATAPTTAPSATAGGAAPVAPAAATGAPLDPVQRVKDWNARFPVGTRVSSSLPGYSELETRTEAMVLFGHRAAVYMKGFNGYFDLEELRAS